MKIERPDNVNLKQGWLFRMTENLAYRRTINAFNKEMRKELREGGTRVMYHTVDKLYLCEGWRLKAKEDGNERAMKELEKVYETGYTFMHNKYFDLKKLKELTE